MQNGRELKESGGIPQGLAVRRGRAGARAGLPSMLGNGNVSDGDLLHISAVPGEFQGGKKMRSVSNTVMQGDTSGLPLGPSLHAAPLTPPPQQTAQLRRYAQPKGYARLCEGPGVGAGASARYFTAAPDI
ncbi:hypothetical protein EYF80_003608 [Liparis tanakae]|uniref:Uncharacterized protein n=1 Tax=Liparis tanakae TaxID=230148 RepID=A0A4Z2J8F5_9TELE|nr:hypothetical protein EYF80_003608 [Liparis tanakae]